MAIGCNNRVSLFCLNSYTLESLDIGVSFEMRRTIRVEQLLFAEQKKLLMLGDSAMLEIVEFGQNESRKQMAVPFYKLMPITQKQAVTVFQVRYTPLRVFALMADVREKWWFQTPSQKSDLMGPWYIQVYETSSGEIEKGWKLTEDDLEVKLRESISGCRR